MPPVKKATTAHAFAVISLVATVACRGPQASAGGDCIPAQRVDLATSFEQLTQTAQGEFSPVSLTATVTFFDSKGNSVTLPEGSSYGLDATGTGAFQLGITASEINLTLPQPRSYALQVTAQACDGGVLFDRANVEVRLRQAPSLSLQVFPSPGSPVRIGNPIVAKMQIAAASDGEPVTIAWSWGDGATASTQLANLALTSSIEVSHQYALPGVFRFNAWLSDAQGVTASASAELLSSIIIHALDELHFGRERRGLAVFAAAGTEVAAAGVEAIAAAGAGGVVTLRGSGAERSAVARLDPQFNGNVLAAAVAADPDRRIAYVLGEETGFYALDLTELEQPRLLTLQPIAPSNAPLPFFDRFWTCSNGRWQFLKNLNGAIYGYHVDDDTLQFVRQSAATPVSNPWSPLRASALDDNSPALVLPQVNAEALACAADRWVFIGAGSFVYVYDLSSFFGVTAAVELVASWSTPEIDGVSLNNVVDLKVAMVNATTYDVYLAAEENGWMQYRLQFGGGSPSVSLIKHFTAQQAVIIEENEYFYDLVHAIGLSGGKLLAAVRSNTDFWATYQFALSEWPSGDANVTRQHIYDADARCTPSALAGTIGPAFPDIEFCYNGLGFFSMFTPALTDRVHWLSDDVGLVPLNPASGAVGERWNLPPELEVGAYVNDGIWLAAAGRQYYLPITTLVSMGSAEFQPAPATSAVLNGSFTRLAPVAPDQAGVLANESSLHWFSVGPEHAFSLLATASVSGGIATVDFVEAAERAAVLRASDRRILLARRELNQIVFFATSNHASVPAMTACSDRVIGWYANSAGDKRYFFEINANGDEQVRLEELLTPATTIYCQGQSLYVVAVGDSGQLELALRDVDAASLAVSARSTLPVRQNAEFYRLAIAVDGAIVALLFQGIDGGVMLFQRDGAAFEFIGGEFTRAAADLRQLLLFNNGGLRYFGGLSGQSYPRFIIRSFDD